MANSTNRKSTPLRDSAGVVNVTAGYTLPKDRDDDESAVLASVVPMSARHAAPRIVERDIKPTIAKRMSESTTLHQAERAHRERHCADVVEAWLRECPPLPAARPPVYADRRRAR